MSLRDEILNAPRGAQRRISELTGYSRKGINRILKHDIGGMEIAVAIAAVWGCPERWHELLDDRALAMASKANYGVLPLVLTLSHKAKSPRKRAS